MATVSDRIFRDFERHTGDGLPGEPAGRPLPHGDPASGVHEIARADLRDWGNSIEVKAATAVTAATDTQGATLYAATVSSLLANTAPSYPVGTIFATRAEGYAYEVVATGGDVATAGGVKLKRILQPHETGYTIQLAGALLPADPGIFGGLYAGLKCGQVINWDNPLDTAAGPRFGLGVTAEIVGGNANGPDNARGGMWLKIEKKDALTSTQTGEIDGLYIQVCQGKKDDAGGILIDARKVKTGSGDTGGLTPMEISGAWIDGSGAETRRVHVIPAFMEGLGGATYGNGSGIYTEARVGDIDSGIHIVGRSDLGAAFSNILVATTSRDRASEYFKIDGLGEIFMGVAPNRMRMRYNNGAFYIRSSAGTTNLMALDYRGSLNAYGGFYTTVVTPAELRSVSNVINTDGKQLGLLRFDGTEWVFAAGTAANSPWKKVADPSVIAHQPV